jgi:anti-sigma-K factor RskA
LNVKEYIESGILEAYVLGALAPEERTEVEENISRYPELAQELKAIEEGMLSFAKAGAEEPPVYLKEQIWDAIVKERSSLEITDKPAAEESPNVRPFVTEKQERFITWQRAAIWAAVICSVLTNFLLLSQRNKLKDEQYALQQQVDTVRQQQEVLAQAVADYNKQKDMLADTSMQAIVMKTMQPGHPMAATIYWSKGKGEAYLAVQKLPPPPSGKQYQMWIIQDGKPVSMGVISNDVVERGMMTKLPMQVTNGQAFAISLEKEGGNPTPTEVMVLGKTS